MDRVWWGKKNHWKISRVYDLTGSKKLTKLFQKVHYIQIITNILLNNQLSITKQKSDSNLKDFFIRYFILPFIGSGNIPTELKMYLIYLSKTFARHWISNWFFLAIGFSNHHKITIQDHVRVPKCWCMWCTWENNKKHISGIYIFYLLVFLRIFPKLVLI